MAVRVNIRELKNRLSYYLRLTRAGETVEITERNRPIGRIVPLARTLEERLDAMATLGLVARGHGRLASRPPVARVRGRGSVADLISEDREYGGWQRRSSTWTPVLW